MVIAVPEGELTVAGKVPIAVLAEYVEPDIEVLEIVEKIPLKIVNFIRGPPEEELDLTGKQPTALRHDYISPDREQLAFSGKAPTLFRERTVAPDREELTLTGKAPDALTAISITPAREELTLVGKVPTVFRERKVDPGREELTLAGKVPTVFRERTVAPDREELALTGKAPSVEQTFVRVVTEVDLTLAGKVPAAGELVVVRVSQLRLRLKTQQGLQLDGKPPIIDVTTEQAPITRDPAEVDLVLTGKVPTLKTEHYRVPAKVGLTLAGKTPSVEQDFVRVPTEGELTLAGKVPEALSQDAVAPSKATLTLAGKVPTLAQTWSAEPGREELTLAGKTPTLFHEDYVTPGREELTLAGKVPTLVQTWSAAPGREELSLVGKTPTLFRQVYAIPGREEFTFVGKAPTLAQTWSVAPGEETLTLAGKVPEVLSQDTLSPVTATLALTGKAPEANETHYRAPSHEELTLSGKVPTFQIVQTALPTEVTLTLAGKTPVVFRQKYAAPGREQLVLAGYAPTTGQAITAEPTEATLALAGKIPGVFRQDSTAPAREELTLVGKAPTLAQTWSAAPGELSLTLTGQACFVVIPDTASTFRIPPARLNLVTFRGLQLFGHAPTVIIAQAGSRNLPVAEGSLALAGKTPTLAYDWVVTPTEETLQLTGYLVNAQTQIAEPGAGSLSISVGTPVAGPPAEIAIPRLQLSLNTYATSRAYGLLLVGHDVTIETEGVRSSDTADLALTTYVPGIVNTTVPPIEVSVPGDQLALQSYWPALEIINPNQESTLILEGQIPISWTTSPTFFPATYPLVVTPQNLLSDVDNNPPEVALTFEGQAPSLESVTLIPGAGSLSIASDSFLVYTEPVSFLPAASLSLTGAAVYIRRTASPSAGVVTISSTAPATFEGTNWVAAPDVEPLAFSGKAPVCNVGPLRYITPYNLTLAGYSVITDQTVSSDPLTRELSLAGYAASVHHDTRIAVPQLDLVLTGQTFKYKRKKVKKSGARTQSLSLTTNYTIELLYR